MFERYLPCSHFLFPPLSSAAHGRTLNRVFRRRTGLLLNPHYATPPALTAVATSTMFRVVSYAGIDGRPHVHAEPLIPAARNSSWQSGGNRLHSDDPAFADFTGGTDPIPLYDVQAA